MVSFCGSDSSGRLVGGCASDLAGIWGTLVFGGDALVLRDRGFVRLWFRLGSLESSHIYIDSLVAIEYYQYHMVYEARSR